MFKGVVCTAPFLEHPIVDVANSKRNEFDVVISDKYTLQIYCESLLSMICSFDKSQVKPFLEYQCANLSEPVIWLNKLEKLIDLNDELFVTKKQKLNIDKASDSINLIRERIETQKRSVKKHRYDFNAVKSKLKEYDTFEDKMNYLFEMEAEYKQHPPKVVNPYVVSFDQQIELEKEKLNQQQILKERTTQRSELINKNGAKNKNKPTLQITCNLNYFADIFYQLHEQGIIIGSTVQIAESIAEHYLDKSGQPISFDSVNTMLKPSNTGKRPKGNSRYKL